MLQRFETDSEILETFEATKDFPSLLCMHCTIESKLKRRFPEAPTTIFLHTNPSGSKLWIAVRDTLYSM